MRVETFCEAIAGICGDFFVGVPDSQLKALCDYLMNERGVSARHIIAANEGNCTALAAGYHLATGKIPVVYMQNSGIGNIVNPAASLLHPKVYGIPCLFVVGWRGEPGLHDEPQHVFQGEVTVKLLEDLEMGVFVLGKDTTEEQLSQALEGFLPKLSQGYSAAVVVRKGALSYGEPVCYRNQYSMVREEIVRRVAAAAGRDPIVSTTGKASRELFEIREQNREPHGYDFLTVGSMGHSSSIALGVALQKPEQRVWCIDGDGATLMHMGSLAVIGAQKPKNLIHILINNEAHETVGGMPTVAGGVDFPAVALACGYRSAVQVDNYDDLEEALGACKEKEGPLLIEAKASIGCRDDLGRPTTTAQENKQQFMNHLKGDR